MANILQSRSQRSQAVNISTTRVSVFLWVNVGSSGSSSDAHIFNRSKLKRRIKNGNLGLPPPEPLGPGGSDLHYFLLGDYTFALMPLLVKPYSKRQLTREETIAKYRIFRGRRVVENASHISEQIQGTGDNHGAKAKGGERHCVNMCGTT